MAENYFFTDDEIQLLFALKFALYRKLDVIIVALIGILLEIIMNRCKKNLFSSILKIQPMTFPNSENAEQTLTANCIGGKLKTIIKNFKKAVDTN